MLIDLVHGATPSSEPAGSTVLGGLMPGAATRPMSVVASLNALRRGEIARPADDGSLTDLQAPDMPQRSPPAPSRPSYETIFDEQAEADAISRAEMKLVLREKTRIAAMRQDWNKARRLAAITSQLEHSRTASHDR
jgi:hypothetical protein